MSLMYPSQSLYKELIKDNLILEPSSPKGRILKAAAKLFANQGYAKTSVRDLASEVGILSGSLFHHFSSKDDILYCLMNEVIIAMNASLKVALSKEMSIEDQIKQLIYNKLIFIHGGTSNACRVLFHEWSALPKEKQKKLLVGRKAYDKLWSKVLSEAAKQDMLVMEVDLLMQLLHGSIAWSVYWYHPKGAVNLDDLVDKLYTMITKTNR